MSEEKQKRVCKGICKQYKAERPQDGNRYANGQVRCLICEIYMSKNGCKDKFGNEATEDTEGLRCKCCNYKVRSKPRNKVYKEKYREQVGINDGVSDVSPLDIEELKNFITTSSKPQANYQYVVIKTLLENNLYATKEKIAAELEFYNKDKIPQDYRKSMVFGVLEERNILISKNNSEFLLNLEDDVDSFDILEAISLCNQKIHENKIKPEPDYFIALGPWENWNHTIDNLPLRWGVADTTPSNIAVYDLASEGDIVFFYSTKEQPTYFSETGFFGVGIIRKKDINKEEQYWPLEQKTNKSFFTHKVFIDVIKFVQSDEELVPVGTGLPLVKGLNHVLPGDSLDELCENVKTKWNIVLESEHDETVNYWKIAPGVQASDWEFQKKEGLIGIGWNELGDLSGKSFESIHQKLRELWPRAIGNNSPQFRAFLSMKKGDVIIANNGKSKVVGIGRISGDYQYQPEMKYAHTYPVEWFDTNPREIPTQSSWFVTITSVGEDLYQKIISTEILSPDILSNEFESLIRKFDADRTLFDKPNHWKFFTDDEKNKQREGFVSKFPIDKIQEIPIEQYVLGLNDEDGEKNRTNFSYLLEQKTSAFGHIGGMAGKFGVYVSRDGEYKFPEQYENHEQAFQAILKQIQKIIDAGKNFVDDHNVQKLSEIIDDRLRYIIHRQIRSKILAVYFPNTFLGITSKQHIDHMLDYFEIPKKSLRGKLTQKQFKIIEQKDLHPIMKNWSVEDYTHFLWNTLCAQSYSKAVEEETEEETDDVVEDVIEIMPLHLPSGDDLKTIKTKIENELLIDGNTIDRIIASLYAGKNILLTGPVGTGKTDLAQKIPNLVWNYYPEVHTATSDWTTQDVIGGIFPKIENEQVKFRIQKGCVTSTVAKNWKDETGTEGVRRKFSKFDSETGKNHDYNGVWLVIDEFNRANIDRAFGQLFTALEYKDQLKMPTEKSGIGDDEDFQTFTIPDDYRIIGTLNTYDKHFLFHLSDALKRRFDFIEISPPPRELSSKEITIVHQKAADNESLQNEIKELIQSNEKTDEKLYEIMAFIRKSKQLGTALLISIFKDMLVYHKMGQSWDVSLDSALVKKIIPQLESMSVSTLGTLKRFVDANLANFFITFSHDDHFEKIEDYVKELETYKKYYFERFNKDFTKDWINEFKVNNLSKLRKDQNRTPEQIEDYKNFIKEFNPWNDELKTPKLIFFKQALDNLIEEKEFTSVNALESNLN